MTLRLGAISAGFAIAMMAGSNAWAQSPHHALEFYSLPASASAFLDSTARVPHVVNPANTVRAQAQRASQADPETQSRARSAFERGVQFAQELNWAEAAESFEESYRLAPRPTTLQNLALAHRALGRYTQSAEELQSYLREGNPAPEVRVEVERLISEMRGQLARLTITSSVATATISLDGRNIPAGTETLTDPGNHVLAVTAPGYNRNSQQFTLARGERRALSVRLERPGGLSAPIILIGSVLIVGSIAGAIYGIWYLQPSNPDCGTLMVCVTPR